MPKFNSKQQQLNYYIRIFGSDFELRNDDVYCNVCQCELSITWWSSWLKAVHYYVENFEKFKNIVMQLDPNDAQSIENLQNLI